MFTSFVSKLLVSTAMLFCMVKVGIGQYNVDSVRILRDQKLEQFSNETNAPLTAEDIRYINHYEPDTNYGVHGQVELLRGEQRLRMHTSDGTSKVYVRYAKVRFQLQCEAGELTVSRRPDLFAKPLYRVHLFLPFTDPTNGVETY